jgi:glucosylceramidase
LIFIRFLDAYKQEGVPIWGITIDNEPKSGDEPHYKFNSLGFTPELQRDFLKMDLGPILEASGYGINTTDLMIFDDIRKNINI